MNAHLKGHRNGRAEWEPPPYDAVPDHPGAFDERIFGESAPTQQPPPAQEPKRPMVLEWFDEACNKALSEPARPLIERLLDETAFSVIYGASNAGKSFVVLDMGCAVSSGRDINGLRTIRGAVIYIAAEGGSRIRKRIAAIRASQHYSDDERPLFGLICYPIDLRSGDADADELIRKIRAEVERIGAPLVWVIVDTLSRSMAGGDENSPVDMGRVVATADRIRAELKCHFTFVHHSGKDQARGARGHSLLRAATDTEIEIEPGKAWVTKQRDMEADWSAGFRLVDVEIGADPSGQPMKSAVVEWLDAPPAKPASEKTTTIPQGQRLLMAVVIRALDEAGQTMRPFPDGPSVRAVADSILRKRYLAAIAENKDTKPDSQRRTYTRDIKQLIKAMRLMAAEHQGERFIWLPS